MQTCISRMALYLKLHCKLQQELPQLCNMALKAYMLYGVLELPILHFRTAHFGKCD